MKYQNLGLLAWRNLKRNIRRNVATGMAIAAGFTAFMLASGYAYRVHRVLSSYTIYALHVGHIGIFKHQALDLFTVRPREFSLTKDDQRKIYSALARTNNIEFQGRYLIGQGLIGNGCKTYPFVATGIDPSVESKIMNHPELLKWNDHIARLRRGENIWDFPEDFGAVSLSQGLAQLLGKLKIHSELGDNKPVLVTDCSAPHTRDLFAADANVQLAAGSWDGSLSAIDGEVVSFYSTGLVETNNTSVVTTVTHLQKLLNTDHIFNISVWVENADEIGKTIEDLKSNLGPLANTYDILPWTDDRLSPYYSGTMQFIYVMVGFIGFVLAIVVILSIFNSATISVLERSQEIGMFRSVGYTRRSIRMMFVIEGFILTFISVVAGAILGLVTMAVINSLHITLYPPGVATGLDLKIAPSGLTILAGAIIVSVLGVLSTYLAVFKVVQQKISTLITGAQR